MNWRKIDSAAIDKQIDGEVVVRDLAEFSSVMGIGGIKRKLLDAVAECADELRHQLIIDSPYTSNEGRLLESEQEFSGGVYDIPAIRSDFAAFRELAKKAGEDSSEEMKIWTKEIDDAENRAKLVQKFSGSDERRKRKDAAEIKKADNHRKILRKRLLKQWRQTLEREQSKWELETIAEYRRKLMAKLREWLDILQKLADMLNGLGFETGLLWDLSKGNLSLGDMEQMRRWAEYIEQNEDIKKLCDMLGRLRAADKVKRMEEAKRMDYAGAFVPDIDSKEEIVGVRIGKDIEYALPQEKALLADAETSVLFDLKFAEGRLMCFDMEGLMPKKEEKTYQREVEEEEKMGPVIICVDTSGSMQGAPEMIAKAVALFMSMRAMAQKRDCLLINFSTGIETLDLSGEMGIAEVMQFLQRSFHGGTDAAPALAYAVKMMGEKNYEKSDLLIVSDFVMAVGVPEDLRAQISEAKKGGNKFYSLCVGNDVFPSEIRETFDNEWVYNPDTGGIFELHEKLQDIGDSR